MSRRNRRNRDVEARRLYEANYRSLAEHPAFMPWLLGVIEGKCNTFGPIYDNSGSRVYFNEGRRSIGIELLQEAQCLAPELWLGGLTREMSIRTERSREQVKELESLEAEEAGEISDE